MGFLKNMILGKPKEGVSKVDVMQQVNAGQAIQPTVQAQQLKPVDVQPQVQQPVQQQPQQTVYSKEHFGLALGVTSFLNHPQDKHCIFIDYDSIDFEEAVKDIKDLQTFWSLGDCDVYQTNKGYHACFWYDHVPLSRAKMIINYSKADVKFKEMPLDHITIRVAGKYQIHDIKFIIKISGTHKENSLLGNTKKKEHDLLFKIHETFMPKASPTKRKEPSKD